MKSKIKFQRLKILLQNTNCVSNAIAIGGILFNILLLQVQYEREQNPLTRILEKWRDFGKYPSNEVALSQ